MHVTNTNMYGPLDEKTLAAFEDEVGGRLPDDYRQFLLEFNGGKPNPGSFKISKSQGGDTLHHAYGLHSGPSYSSIRSAYRTFEGRVPKSLVPIADDPFGNQICIGISGRWQGKVCFWDHEKENDSGRPTSKAVTQIAASFTEFLSNLYEYIPEGESLTDRIVRLNDVTRLQQLIASGWDMESEDEYGRTALVTAAIHGRLELVKLLFESGARPHDAIEVAETNRDLCAETPEEKSVYQEIIDFLNFANAQKT